MCYKNLMRRPFFETYTPTTEERYAVNVVDQPGVSAAISLF